SAWDTGAVPTPNDWVLIQGRHTIVLPSAISSDTNRLQVRGICILQNGVLQSDFNRHNTSPSRIHLFAASIRNQGTITGAGGVNGSGPENRPDLYDHATNGSSLLIYVNRFENDVTGQVLSGSRGGRGGNEFPHLYLSHGQYMNSQGGHGGRIEIFPAIFINNGRVQGGFGGDADNFNHWGDWIDGNVRGGNGGLVRVFSTNLAMSSNAPSVEIRGGCGGYADGVGRWQTTTNTTTITTWRWTWWRTIWRTNRNTSSNITEGTRRTVEGGIGGNASVNVGDFSGLVASGCNGQTFNRTLENTVNNTERNTRWRTWVRSDPTTIKMSNTTRFEETENIVIFGGEDWIMDLRELSEGAFNAGETITLAIGKDGVIDLRGVSGKVFKAGTKLEIFADKILLDDGVTLADLADTPEIIVKPSKILYNVEASYPEHIVGEPGKVIPVTVTLNNAGPTEDTYTISTNNTAGWDLGLPPKVQVNSMRRSELAFEITLPETRGEENVITLTATSQGDSEVQAVAEIRVTVKKAERITARTAEDQNADIVLAIDDTITMASELFMVSNAIESFLGQFVKKTWPSEEEVEAFMAPYSEENPPSDEELNAFMAPFEIEAPSVELITFKDDVTSRVVTSDLGDVITRIRSIQPSGGDDCPNASVAAIESALENINPNGQIFIATASAPHKDAAAAIAKAQENGVKVHVILTGSCGDEATEKALYKGIADETKGTFNWLPRGLINPEVLNV
ncbi:MAG: vWA domain-containing protein, partial [Candidatus Parabeggiatoa sp.]|nr:vWA domain-containing protein [Candidatus Parabeggiatoa sp.]